MYRLLIVDDEVNIREGLRDFVPWGDFGIEVTGEAADGEQGLAQARALAPDIILTDIIMPGMNGLQMAMTLRADGSDACFLFLSAYDRIDYLKAAFKLSAVDYILKPFTDEELGAALRRAVGILNARAAQAAECRSLSWQKESALGSLCDLFFSDLCAGRLFDNATIEAQLLLLEYPLAPRAPYLCALFYAPYAHARLRGPLETGLAHLCVMHEGVDGVVFSPAANEFCALVTARDTDLLRSQMCALHAGIMDAAHCQVLLGLSDPVEGLGNVSAAYREARLAVGHELFGASSEESAFSRGMVRVLERGLCEALSQVRALVSMGGPTAPTLDDVRDFCLHALLSPLFPQTTLDALVRHMEAIRSMAHAAQLLSYMEAQSGGQDSTDTTVQRACAYIKEHLAQELTVQRIAEQMHFSPGHLSTLFKKELGATVGDTVTRLRMQEAGRQLQRKDARVYQVAQAVGYRDTDYFARLFRNAFGVTPTEFRAGERAAHEES